MPMSKARMLIVALLFAFGVTAGAGIAGDLGGKNAGGYVTQGGSKNGKDDKKKEKKKTGQGGKQKRIKQ